MQKNLWFPLILLLIVASFVGCLDNLGMNATQEDAPEIPELVIFKAPESANAPENLKNSIEMLNGYLATGYTYLSIATINHPNTEDNVSIWTVTVGNFKADIRAEKENDGSVHWKVTINGSDGTVAYNNWVALEGTSDVSGKSGTWHIFAENSQDELAEFEYEVSASGIKSGKLLQQNSSAVYEVENRPDKSGRFVKRENGAVVYEANWNADGTGTWKVFDSSGNISDSGSWN